jgi:tRNA (guanine37-N1)-methyltransferase
MRILDPSFFTTLSSISAARIYASQHISQTRQDLIKSGDILTLNRISNVAKDPEKPDLKCILLNPNIKHDDTTTWSTTIQRLVSNQTVGLIPYTLKLEYKYWTYYDIISSILPEDLLDDLPTGFQVVGHLAHLNLRDKYKPYKDVIARVLMDKNDTVTTVINKLDDVGSESIFRTFHYEVIGGNGNMLVTHSEQGCKFTFDYAKVYWNSRLHTEHERLVGKMMQGEAVCDVMAGVGPFALPAGKKQVFVFANDLNPESYYWLGQGVQKNKVEKFVKCFNSDGATFIQQAVRELWDTNATGKVPGQKQKRIIHTDDGWHVPLRKYQPFNTIRRPNVFSHFVMNLPDSALTFLPAFISLYSANHIPPGQPLPKIHVYCFGPKVDDTSLIADEILGHISTHLQHQFTEGRDDVPGEVEIYDVRDVAPNKRMFCASFTLPEEVAYRA